MTINRGMFLLRNDGELVEMRESAYDSEKVRQGMMAR